ncbi:CSMD3-like protein [Mya arenaria]|uniref:CSMD3-like protein n=1 Tax=Mya arenaria TaxID=6604 RepID=A0ABY7DJL2_MYAAR|nr:CSMD3-like protein [Mya arenaria]
MLKMIALFAICCVVSGSHFRGAIIMWEPDSDSILIHFRISWRRSGGHSCDDNTISSGSLIGSGTMSCLSGCTGDVGSLLYQCTDFDAIEDWTTGRYTVRYAGCCWISTLMVGADSSWSFKASVDLTLRSDTGLINRSPTVEMAPVVALLRGCDYVISLPVGDVDGDIVRCRWANAADECSGVLRSLTTISPIGMVRSNVEHISDNVWNYLSVNVSWIPTQTDSGRDHSLCYYATDNNLGLSNVIRCIKIPVSVKEPTPLRVERQGISNTWIIVIDQTFNRPTNSAFITMYESENNTAIISIDVSTSSDVIYDPINRRISVTFNYVFDIDKKYHVSIPSGLVEGYVSCGAVSHAINDSSFWPIELNCGPLVSPQNGNVLVGNTTYGEIATYTCDFGHALIGNNSRDCLGSGQWSDSEPTCVLKDCGTLPDTPQGSVYTPFTTYGAFALYDCQKGYHIEGSKTRQCQVNERWSSPVPTCILTDCGNLTSPINGDVLYTATLFDDCATYSCNDGYEVVGERRVCCQENATWTSMDTVCIIKDCGPLYNPDDGRVIYSNTTYGSQATFECDVGYEGVGASQIVCLSNASWSESSPFCRIKDCYSPSVLTNGSASFTNTTYQSVCVYSCDTGFDLIGDNISICLQDECGHLVHPVNGTVSYSNMTYGATAFYVCETGNDLIGDDKTECLSNGSWSELPPVCYIKDCFDPHEPSNGTVTYVSTTYGSHSQYKCDNGFDLIGGSISTCTAHGNWSDPEIFCQIKDCGHPVSPKNGNVAYEDTKFQAIAQYTCDTGYSLIGNNLRICNKDGMWSDQPYCQIKECGHLVHPVNGTVSYSNMTYGATAFYVCETGYDLIGDDKTECLSNGSWSEPPPACYIKDCFDPHEPSNGTVTYVSTTYGSHSQYKCDDGFDLIGGFLSTCTAHGNWSDPEIFCQIKECPVPDGINNGLVNYTAHEFMSVVAYECYPGYVLVGDATRTCESNGNWSSVHPVCTIKDCGPISPPTNGTVEISDTVYRSSAMFNCDLGYTLHGNNTAECLEDGQWSYGGPSCEIKDCGPVEEFSNGNAIQAEGTTYGARVWFTCNDGYTFAGNDTTSCTYTGEWDSKVPFCQKIVINWKKEIIMGPSLQRPILCTVIAPYDHVRILYYVCNNKITFFTCC